jgi:hypothetical protein
MGWAIVAFLGVTAVTGEGEAAERSGEPAVSSGAAAAEARARWVLDRFEEEIAVIVGEDGARTVPRRSLAEGAREGDVLDARSVPDPAATARARAALARLRRRLRAEGAPPEAGGDGLGPPADPANPRDPEESAGPPGRLEKTGTP